MKVTTEAAKDNNARFASDEHRQQQAGQREMACNQTHIVKPLHDKQLKLTKVVRAKLHLVAIFRQAKGRLHHTYNTQ